jgi:hypothetical protein
MTYRRHGPGVGLEQAQSAADCRLSAAPFIPWVQALSDRIGGGGHWRPWRWCRARHRRVRRAARRRSWLRAGIEAWLQPGLLAALQRLSIVRPRTNWREDHVTAVRITGCRGGRPRARLPGPIVRPSLASSTAGREAGKGRGIDEIERLSPIFSAHRSACRRGSSAVSASRSRQRLCQAHQRCLVQPNRRPEEASAPALWPPRLPRCGDRLASPIRQRPGLQRSPTTSSSGR